MQQTALIRIIPVLLLAVLLFAGCAEDSPSSVPATRPGQDRLAVLEAEVATLKADAAAREAAMKQELALIRTNLDHIKEMLKVREQAEAIKQPETPGETVDKSLEDAKKSIRENLDRLTDVTKKLLDKMEKEIDEQMKKLAPQEKPEGEQI